MMEHTSADGPRCQGPGKRYYYRIMKNEHLDIVGSQLDRVLGFFERVDSKASALFVIVDGDLLGDLSQGA